EIAGDRRREVETDAEFLELNRQLPERGHDRNRELSAGEEARLLAVVGNQVGLGQALEVAALVQRADERAGVPLRVEQEDVEEVAEVHLAFDGDPVSRFGPREILERDRWELAIRGPPAPVDGPCRSCEERRAELTQGAAVHFGDP